MTEKIVAWHFVVDIPQAHGRVVRNCYALGTERARAAEAVSSEHPAASFRIDAGSPLTAHQLDKALGPGNGMLRDETVRCV